MASPGRKIPMNFKGMPQVDVPQGRNGRHKAIVTRILSDLDQLAKGVALKIPLADLADTKENVRSALNRATRKGGRHVATASDDTQRVEFWVDWVLVATDTAPPFEAVVDLASLGRYGDTLPDRRWAYAYG